MGTPLTFTIQIAGTTYDIKEGAIDFHPQIEQRTKLTFTVLDPSNAFTFQKGQQITLTDSASTISFTGTISTSIKYRVGTGNFRQHDIDCNDLHQVADERTTNRIYNGQYAGVIMAGMANDVLSGDGVTANYAIREDNTQAEFGQGTLSGTSATSNLGGDLELSPAGSPVTIVENSSSVFNSGTLTNCQVSGNSLIPTPTGTIKLQGTESLTQDGNAYTYIKIFSSGSISIISGRYLAYDIWIDPSSPSGQAGVDIVFTDGTTLRDTTQDYRYYDSQNIPPHPKNDLSGFANGKWYHRRFLLDNFAGKTISYVQVALEGDKTGTYTAYFKNIYEVDASNNIINTFFNGTLNVNPPQQMRNSGYSNISCTIINTYDCSSSYRVSPSYSISSAGIVKNSFISWIATQPSNTNVLIEYSLDGGNSYITCTNNSALTSLLAGLSVGSLSIQFRQTFQQLTSASPESQPSLSSMQAFINPSYTATKSDVTLSATTNSQWNAGSFSNTQVNNGVLSLLGLVRNFINTDLSGFTLFGAGSSGGPSFANCTQHCNLGTFWVQVGNNLEARARYDSVGSWQNFRIDTDIYIDTNTTYGKPGIVYRTTGWSNYDGTFAYGLECTLDAIKLYKGSNNAGATSNFAVTLVASASLSLSQAGWHTLTANINGSTHTFSLDNVQYINATDSAYTAAGNFGFRASNVSTTQGYQGQFNNFGISVTGLSGTWTSPSQSLSGAGTYGGSVVTWEDVSIGNQSTTVLVQSSVDGGSTWQTCTNGGPIPNLTLGQSLSGKTLQLKVTLSTQTASCMPQIQYLVARVMGGYSSSGTRIAPVLSLAPALIAGSTVCNWSAVTPPNTSITVAISTDNVTYTGVSNGGAIAGITTQPAPMLDTFAVDDHTSYTHLQRTGGSSGTWVWDTANSRVTVSGGTNDMQLWTAISVSDIDVMADLDQADCVGLVWRQTNASNFYELDIFDASSNAGSTNAVKLYKVVSNAKTQLGSTAAIAFTRGTPHRFHVLMVGTSITIYMDGVQLISTTDSSLAGPGKAGFIEVSGTGHFYNLRIQPQGQSLSGVSAYTKVTLTSTDPTVTPQLTDLVLCALHPNIGLGALISTVDYSRTFFSSNADDLAKKSDYYWQINPNKALIFNPRTEVPAPWILTSNDILFTDDGSPSTLSVENSGDLYRNRMILQGAISTISITETHPGDGKSTSWTLKYPVVGNAPTISVNGQTKTIGQKGIDTGKDFYYALNSTSLAQDSSGTVLQPNVDSFTISYTGQSVIEVQRDNTGGFPGTTTQSQYAALTGGAGIVEVVEDVSSQQLSVAAAQSYGDGQLQRYGVIGRTLVCMTNRTGLSVGQYIPVFIPELGLNDASMLITDMDLTMEVTLVGNQASMLYYWKLTLIEGPKLGSWQKTLLQAFNS